MEFIAIGVLIVIVAWLARRVWLRRRATQEAKDAMLHKAWHVVLDDPDYERRRRYEERLHEVEDEARKDKP
ncbi:MAG TPA: hypothetical protein VFB31_00065 [Pseudolabrys sp.]|nr:hypothetical protein [Pseudolabrys sp.]